MGLKQDLKFKGNDFSNVASASAIAHLVMQVPNSYIVQRLPVSKWLSSCVLAWGMITICTAFVTNTAGMMTARVFLSLAEATITPSLMLITSSWYTKSEQAPRFAVWHSAPGVGQICGGLMSFAFQGIPRDGRFWSGWRLMYITLGVMTIGIGTLAFFWLPDTPMNAKFLKTDEKVAVLNHVSVNMTGVANYKARPKEIAEAFSDPQVYLLVLPGVFVSVS
jgi:MFS family permease